MTGDLTDAKIAASVVRQTVEEYGRLDCLIHMVGAWEGGPALEDTGESSWDRMLAVNLRAAFLMMRAAIRPMKQAGGGCIVLVGSTVALSRFALGSHFLLRWVA